MMEGFKKMLEEHLYSLRKIGNSKVIAEAAAASTGAGAPEILCKFYAEANHIDEASAEATKKEWVDVYQKFEIPKKYGLFLLSTSHHNHHDVEQLQREQLQGLISGINVGDYSRKARPSSLMNDESVNNKYKHCHRMSFEPGENLTVIHFQVARQVPFNQHTIFKAYYVLPEEISKK